MSKHDKAPNYKLRQGIALTLGTTALVAGALSLNKANDNNVAAHYNKIESDAIMEAKTVENAVKAIRSGATVRTSPTMGANAEDGSITTFAFKVSEGQVVVVDRPIEFTDDNGDNWAGFELASKPAQSGSADVSHLLWVNESQLDKDSPAGNQYVTTFAYSDSDMPINPRELDISVNEFNILETPNLKGGYLLAVGQKMTDAQFTERVSRENLDIVG